MYSIFLLFFFSLSNRTGVREALEWLVHALQTNKQSKPYLVSTAD